MPGFTNLHIKGYRRLFDVNIEFRPLTVMIGANGVGKTSLLEVFRLLAASASGRLYDTISEFGGLSEILTRDRSQAIDLRLSTSEELGSSLDYDMQLMITGQTYQISTEMLSVRGMDGPIFYASGGQIHYKVEALGAIASSEYIAPNWKHNPKESALSQAPRMFQSAEAFRQHLASLEMYSPIDVGPRSSVRLPQAMRPSKLPGVNGEDLVSCLYYLKEENPDRFETFEETVRTAFSGFKRFAFPPVAAGTITMTWFDNDFSKPLYMHQLSEGTLRFLWLVALLLSDELPAITLIDEPEVSLHPELLSLLADLLRGASHRSQIIVATHSDRLVRHLNPEELLVCDLEQGLTSMTWADAMDIDHWMQDYTLDELWSMAILGGRS